MIDPVMIDPRSRRYRAQADRSRLLVALNPGYSFDHKSRDKAEAYQDHQGGGKEKRNHNHGILQIKGDDEQVNAENEERNQQHCQDNEA